MSRLHICSTPGARAERPENIQARKATAPSRAGLETIGLFVPFAVLLQGWETRPVCRATSQRFCPEPALGGAVAWTSNGSMLGIHCKYRQVPARQKRHWSWLKDAHFSWTRGWEMKECRSSPCLLLHSCICLSWNFSPTKAHS